MTKIKLSVALATYNEEKNIGFCLKAVKDIADEIIVVDGSSTDNTREIAKEHGAEVIKTTNKPIFHINKQMAIDKCQGEWILQLDADEVVSEKLKEEIKRISSEGEMPNAKSYVAFYLKRKNFFLGRWMKKTGQYPDPVIRFFKRGKARLPCKSVHEQMEVDGEVGTLEGHLLHYPYPDFSEYLVKSNRYTSLTAQEMIESGIKPSFCQFVKAYLKAEKTFWSLFLRHKGFLDGFPGFVFSAYSGLHHLTAYIKFRQQYSKEQGSSSN
jgi:glycosyltransferase involved in cell wall biosynthesis